MITSGAIKRQEPDTYSMYARDAMVGGGVSETLLESED